MSGKLQGKRIAIVATDGFEEVELTEPRKALEAAGAKVDIISPKEGQIRGWKFTEWGDSVKVDKTLEQAKPADYDGLVLPGGQINPDKLRIEPRAVTFVRDFFNSGRPVGAICHGPWLLVEAAVVKRKTLTSWPSIRTDIRNAGGHWVDEEVVTDGNLTTSRKPDDLPAFNERLIREFSQGKPSQSAGQTAKAS
ncbi:MAG: type 1 glutamine amidotransferase domain-containing protein [Acidobacteriaceae bacterium]